MNYFDALIIGVVEGVTEFLPISSTGHMIVVSDFLGLTQSESLKSFEIIIQFAAILAVVIYYRKKIVSDHMLMIRAVVVSIPILLIGYLLADTVRNLFTVSLVAQMFIVGGIVFLITEYFYQKKKHVNEETSVQIYSLSYLQLFALGCAQALALIPGTSRSGATIVGGLWLGLSRKAAAEFSFLLAIPVIGVVTFYDVITYSEIFSGSSHNTTTLMIGFVTAFVVAYFSIVFFVRYIERYSFIGFGIYRILFGLFLLIL